MKIVLHIAGMEPGSWQHALQRAGAAARLELQLQSWAGQPTGAQYAVAWLPPRELFERERNLRAVFNLGAGVDALLAGGVVPARLPIIRLLDAGMAPKIAEYVCFALARITRGLERFTAPAAQRDWDGERPRGGALSVGVMGLGAIGVQIAQAARRFDYAVLGWSRSRHSLDGVHCFAASEQLDEFLSRTQVLVNALPLTPATENLLDRRVFAKLPHGAHVINIGRGATIVDEDLIAALDDGQLASATLDVFCVEPLPPAHPFWAHPKITVTPHLSGPTPLGPAAAQIVDNLVQLERGVPAQQLPGYVDRARGY